MSRFKEEQEEYRKRVQRLYGSMPGLKTKDVKTFRAKVFKSGNSLALRLPAGLGLAAGMEMELRVENGDHFSFEPVERRKRKFNVEKVWGSATGLELIKPEDRFFSDRRLLWDEQDGDGPGTDSK
jgi:antitoxin VapB